MTSINMLPIFEPYLLASTPGHLYRSLRACPEVKKLVSWAEGDLRHVYNFYATRNNRTAENVALCYAILVALSFVPGADESIFENCPPYDLDWWNEIRELALKDMT